MTVFPDSKALRYRKTMRVCQNSHIPFFCFFASSLLDFPYAAINSVFLP